MNKAQSSHYSTSDSDSAQYCYSIDIDFSVDFNDQSMNDPAGFLKVVDDECGISASEVLLASPEEDCKPSAEVEKNLLDDSRNVPELGDRIYKPNHLYPNLKRNSADIPAFVPFSLHGINAQPTHQNPTIRELQEVSNSQKRRRRSGHPDRWNAHLEQLRQFKAEFGHCRVPQSFPANQQLANWAHNQRKEYKLMLRGKPSPMTEERVRALEAEGFNWAFRANRLTWEDRFRELQEFKAHHGNCLVPVKYDKNPTLGHWVINQRAQYKQFKSGKPTNMTEERAALLEAEGFVWVVDDKKSFDERILELRQYRAEYGTTLVPHKCLINPQLGVWIMNLRIQYRLYKENKQSTLNEERIALLDAEGMVWELKGDVWDKRLEELIEYKRLHGDCKVPARYASNPQLGQWVTNQRRQHKLLMQGKKSFISRRQIEELEALDFVWSLVDQVPWEERFAELQTFKSQYGHCNVPRNHPENTQLGHWCSTQRVQYKLMTEGKRTAITMERIRLLEAEGFSWGLFSLKAEEDIDELNNDIKENDGIEVIGDIDLSPTEGVNLTTVPTVEGTMTDAPIVLHHNINIMDMTSTVCSPKDDEKQDNSDLPPVLPPPEVNVNEYAFTSV